MKLWQLVAELQELNPNLDVVVQRYSDCEHLTKEGIVIINGIQETGYVRNVRGSATDAEKAKIKQFLYLGDE